MILVLKTFDSKLFDLWIGIFRQIKKLSSGFRVWDQKFWFKTFHWPPEFKIWKGKFWKREICKQIRNFAEFRLVIEFLILFIRSDEQRAEVDELFMWTIHVYCSRAVIILARKSSEVSNGRS